MRSAVPDAHRPVAEPCSNSRPSTVPDGGFVGALDSCHTDQDCADGGLDGRCVVNPGTGFPICTWDQCVSDSDCSDGGVCACRDYAGYDINACVTATCHVDSDCGDGGYCSPMNSGCPPFIGTVGYYCHTAQDQCFNDDDCEDSTPTYCLFDPHSRRWLCAPLDCTG